MSYSSIIGQEEALRVLRGALTSGKPGHAYLFHGPGGVGKTTAAHSFARALNCERGGPEACGECLSCRRAEHGNLRDVIVIEPGSKSGQTIEIEQVRDLIARASTRPTEGRRKVFVMPQAHRLSPPAMHTLLKTLEEPPDFVTLLLETRDLTALLPTILSRCQTVRFRPLSHAALVEVLKERKIPTDRAEVAAAYAQGSAGEALQLATDNAVWKRREQTLDLLAGVSRLHRAQALKAAEEFQKIAASVKSAKSSEASSGDDTEGEESAEAAPSKPEEPPASTPSSAVRSGVAAVVQIALAWYGDLLALQSGGESESLRNPDRRDDLTHALSRTTPEQLYASLDFLLRSEYLLQRNANPRLLCENLMLRLCPAGI